MLPLPIVAAALALAVSPAGRGGALTVLGGAIESAGVGEAPLGWRQMGGAWVRIPQRALPWGAVHFLGGAALGAAPQLVYDRLLSEVCERAQVAVIAVPYSPEQDHDKLARQVSRTFRAATAACEAEGLGPWPAERTVRLGHSLGGKLCAILACEPGAKERVGTLAFNNFGVEDSIAIATDVLQELGGAGGRDAEVADALRGAIGIAQAVGRAQGIAVEFVPSPAELDLRLTAQYGAPDTAVWTFESDTLDSSPRFLAALPASAPRRVSSLPGPHTAPALLRLSASAFGPALGVLLGDRSLSLGDEELVDQIAEEVAVWVWPAGVKRASKRALPPAGQASAPN